ncbi:thermonuclease [Bacillus cereus]|uniref:Thermonuclease n=1 Tax=Bacillus cereus TaxID=1396 RepID=A0A9X7HNB6_BACCE|nr:thermonuclease [Bacillus cereus]PHG82974.1 thermonuclease [Bacillus cereus]
MTACSSKTQITNESRSAQTMQKGIQQSVEGQRIVDIPEAYKG